MFLWNLMAGMGYTLIEIEDEEMPLASMPLNDGGTFVWLWFLLVLLASGFAYYVTCCIRYRKRIAELKEEQQVYLGWNLRQLKETVQELEYDKVSRMELSI